MTESLIFREIISDLSGTRPVTAEGNPVSDQTGIVCV